MALFIKLGNMTLRAIIFAVLLFSIAAVAFPVAAQIVPDVCRGPKIFDNPSGCTICHIGVMAMNITRFLMFYIAIPAVALLIAIGGIMLLISGGSETLITKGKDILRMTVIGAVIVFLAWLGVDTAIKLLAGGEKFRGLENFGPWYEIRPEKCPLSGGDIQAPIAPATALTPSAPALTTTPTPTPPTTAPFVVRPTPSVSALANQAQDLLRKYPGSFSTSADCGGANHADGTLLAVASGTPPPVCSQNCECKPGGTTGKVTLDSRVMFLADKVLQTYSGKVEATSFTTGRHNGDSLHYQGRAVDFKIKPGSNLGYRELEFVINNSMSGDYFMQCESGGKSVNCRSPSSPIDHLHAQYNR